MTCVEAAVAFIDRLEVPPELEQEATAAYAEHEEKLRAAGLHGFRATDVVTRSGVPGLPTISSAGNLAAMDEDSIRTSGAGQANVSYLF